MNILLSSYSVNPYHGSEDGVGWNWTMQVAKHFNTPDDKIYLVTKKVNEKDTRKGIEENGLKNVELIISDTPDWLNWYREHNSAFHHIYYILWQRYAYKWAKKSGIDFDIIHHVTMVDFRITGYMWEFKEPYTIFGPVGGGQSTPKALKEYEASKAVEKFRELINKSRAISPTYKRALRQFNRAFAINGETKAYMAKALGRECELLSELAITDNLKNLDITKTYKDKTVKLVYVGRLIEKKGLMLLLDVIKELPSGLDFTLDIYGDGPLKEKMQRFVSCNRLDDKVKILGAVEHSKISAAYSDADVFIMPSLRETSGTVLVEAMAHKLPIVALDMSVCSEFKKYDCGMFVNVYQSKESLISEFADKLSQLINSPELRIKLGEKGYAFANSELTWENKFKKVYADFIQQD